MRLTKEDKKRLYKRIEDKVSGRVQITNQELADEFNINLSNARRYIVRVKHKLEIERIKESYETEIRRLKALTVQDEGQADLVLSTLYDLCISDKKENACIAWLRGTGRMKEAEIQARKKKGGEDLDWRTAVVELWDNR